MRQGEGGARSAEVTRHSVPSSIDQPRCRELTAALAPRSSPARAQTQPPNPGLCMPAVCVATGTGIAPFRSYWRRLFYDQVPGQPQGYQVRGRMSACLPGAAHACVCLADLSVVRKDAGMGGLTPIIGVGAAGSDGPSRTPVDCRRPPRPPPRPLRRASSGC